MDDDDDDGDEDEGGEGDFGGSARMFRVAAAAEAAAIKSDSIGEWARTFRAAAEADDYAIFRDHLRRLELPDEPLLLLEGTIHFVVMWSAFFSLDHTESFARMLRMQTYDAAQATEARYAFTFDLCGRAYARVLVDTKYGNLDLADMNEAPWNEYRVAGYCGFWVSHLDWSPLAQKERRQLEEEIEGDLYYDYSRQELQVDFIGEDWDDFDETCLRVRVQEIDECDQEVDESEDTDEEE